MVGKARIFRLEVLEEPVTRIFSLMGSSGRYYHDAHCTARSYLHYTPFLNKLFCDDEDELYSVKVDL